MKLSLVSGVTQTGTKIMLRDRHGCEGKGKAAGQAVALGPHGRRVLVGGQAAAIARGEVCLDPEVREPAGGW